MPQPDYHCSPEDSPHDIVAPTPDDKAPTIWRLQKALRVFITCVVCLFIAPMSWLLGRISLRFSQFLSLCAHRIVLRLLAVKVNVVGLEHLSCGPCVIASNHQSWLDIPIIGSIARCTFISSQELARDPFLRFLADIQYTIYVNRAQRTAVRDDATKIYDRLKKGERMILFAEATTSNGSRVLPFRSGLFSLVDVYKQQTQQILPVQPVSVIYHHSSGLAINHRSRPAFSWYGNMDFYPSLKSICGDAPLEVTVIIHRPLANEMLKNRKIMSDCCEKIIRNARAQHARGVPAETLIDTTPNEVTTDTPSR